MADGVQKSFHISGIRNSTVVVDSSVRDMHQTFGGAGAEDASRQELKKLMEALDAALKNAPSEQKPDAEAVAEEANHLVARATAEKPNKKLVEISGQGLLEAAKAVAGALPIAEQIVSTVAKAMGLG
jgi:hypothetical protein